MKAIRLLPLILAVGVLAISTAAPLVKLCEDAAPAVIAAARMGIASCILVPTAVCLRGRKLLHAPAAGVHLKYAALAGLFLALHFFFWISSLKHTSVLSSVVIVTTNPIFVGLGSFLLFKERIGRRLIVAIVLAIGGGVLIFVSDAGQHSAEGSLYGDFLSLCGALMASCYFLVGRRMRREVDALAYITPVYAVAAVILVGMALAGGHGFSGYGRNTYFYFVLLAVGPQLVGHSSLNWALRHVSATAVTVFILGEPIGAGLIAYFLLDESPGAWQLLGSVLIMGGILIAARASVLSSGGRGQSWPNRAGDGAAR